MKSIIIYDWMLSDPRLPGIKLLIYAVVYSFISLGSSCFLSSDSWIAFLHCSKSQFYKAKKELIKDGVLIVAQDGRIVSCNLKYEPFIKDSKFKDDLNEMIRIAKTPWVFDE